MVFTMNIQFHQTHFQTTRAPRSQNLSSCGHTQAGRIAMPHVEEVKNFKTSVLSKHPTVVF